MPNWAGLILGQIPRCMEQNSSQMLWVCLGRVVGGFGLDWYISEHRGQTMCQVVANKRLKQWRTKRLSPSPLIKT